MRELITRTMLIRTAALSVPKMSTPLARTPPLNPLLRRRLHILPSAAALPFSSRPAFLSTSPRRKPSRAPVSAVELGGVKIARDDVVREDDPTNNIPDSIFSKLGTQLHRRDSHPLGILKNAIHDYFDTNCSNKFVKFDDLCPIVTTKENFDDVLVPADHVSRTYNDTYYVDAHTVLRCHTSAHQAELLRKGHTHFLVTGDVYGRDSIDSSHYPVFHQMEGFRVFSSDEWVDSGEDATSYAATDLKKTLEGLAKHLFGAVEMRWVDTYFPFTNPSFELEIYFQEKWMEVLGCGVTEQEILKRNGRMDCVAWAFGLGLERLAMVLFEIPDIRLFWSNDQRFTSQFSGGRLGVKFKPFSKFPPCYKDMSLWINDSFTENNLCEIVRGVAGYLAEEPPIPLRSSAPPSLSGCPPTKSENIIGKGGYAEVYKGCLEDGQLVAIKRLTRGTTDERTVNFLSELGIIVHIDHPNAAKLVGVGVEGGMHLVFELSTNGSLADLLHGSKGKLDWEVRYNIAIGTAEGLKYLHERCQRRIIHRDIKAANILLTEDFKPQICDFGLAKWLPDKLNYHTVSTFEGTFGYLAPEYFMHGIIDEKTDVFAFGVLLLELIAGRKAIDSSQKSLVMWAKPLLESNDFKDLIDPSLGDAYDYEQLKLAAQTALLCIHQSSIMRPCMSQVIELLKGEESTNFTKMRKKPILQRTYSEELLDAEENNATRYLNDLSRLRHLALDS